MSPNDAIVPITDRRHAHNGSRSTSEPPAQEARRQSNRFVLEPWDEIKSPPDGEWLIDGLFPRQGVGVLFGKSRSLKSFIALHLGASVAVGFGVAARNVWASPCVYIAAEGAGGLRKRKEGLEGFYLIGNGVPFFLISAAPNLGTGTADLEALIAALQPVAPRFIIIDTASQSLGGGDENGSGMLQLVSNATALANRFKAFVLVLHHPGHSDDQRLRGHSSLFPGLDVVILCERDGDSLSSTLTVQKLKDDEDGFRLQAQLFPVDLEPGKDGADRSTLVVRSLEDLAASPPVSKTQSGPKSRRLLMAVLHDAISEAGELIRPFGGEGPEVRAIAERRLRDRYYARVAEKPEPDEDPGKVADRRRKAFSRSLDAAINDITLVAGNFNGERFLWLPRT